jgi:hypothetical protein
MTVRMPDRCKEVHWARLPVTDLFEFSEVEESGYALTASFFFFNSKLFYLRLYLSVVAYASFYSDLVIIRMNAYT